jgi:hypothetical protein
MSKVMLGMLVGAVLGFFDGLTAWFTPEARPMLLGIVIGSTIKGFIAGLVAGWVARRSGSMTWAVISGLAVGLVLSSLAAMGSDVARAHFFEIVIPGTIVGAIAGFASQRFGAARSYNSAT